MGRGEREGRKNERKGKSQGEESCSKVLRGDRRPWIGKRVELNLRDFGRCYRTNNRKILRGVVRGDSGFKDDIEVLMTRQRQEVGIILTVTKFAKLSVREMSGV